MGLVLDRFLFLLLIIAYLATKISALNCHCDDGAQCKSGTCQAPKNWYGPEHCQLLYDPSVNGDKAWKGCILPNSNCDIVSETNSLDITFNNGKLSSFGGCCGDENCDAQLESRLNQIKNSTCNQAIVDEKTDFSCACDPNDMLSLFDISVERGVQWLSTTVGVLSNGSNVYENSTRLRRRMSEFCTNNVCSANSMLSAGISVPSNAFPVCAHYLRADTGKTIRGCTFAPRTVAQKETLRRVQSTFPANPIAGAYDVRVGVNVSSRYNFIFECRSQMCNEQETYASMISQCLPGISIPSLGQVAVEPPVPIVGSGVAAGSVETSTVAGVTVNHQHHIDINETVIESDSTGPSVTEIHRHQIDINETIVQSPTQNANGTGIETGTETPVASHVTVADNNESTAHTVHSDPAKDRSRAGNSASTMIPGIAGLIPLIISVAVFY